MSLIRLSWSTLRHKGLRLQEVRANSNCLLGYNAVQTCMWIPTFWGPTDIFPSSSWHDMQTAVPPTRLHAFTTKNSAASTFTDVKACKLTIEGPVSYIRHWMFNSRSGCFTRGGRAADSHWTEGGKVAELVRTWRLKERSPPVAHPQPVRQFTELRYRIKMPTDQILLAVENKNLTTRTK